LTALAVTTTTLSRWQFGTTIIYHFFFAPVTIGMGIFVASLQTVWYVTRQDYYRRLTSFFGKILLVNIALGIVTGIVQEFQFGMNWATYSRYVGDVFGTPLAMEGLIAFFLESVLIGVWIFAAGKIGAKAHLAVIWAVALGSVLSAYFILAANSWMQHPVGYRINPVTHRAEMTSLWKILSQANLLEAFGHVMAASIATAGALGLAVSAYHLLRKNDVEIFGHAARISLGVLLFGGITVVTAGHFLDQLVARQQPMKASASEAVFKNETGAGLSLFAIQPAEKYPSKNIFNIEIPYVLSFLTNWHYDSTVPGVDNLNRQYQAKYGPGNYKPMVIVTYWVFRLMVGIGFFFIFWGLLGLWLARKRHLERSTWFLLLSIPVVALPFLANSFGWVLREMGRQPWIVQGLLKTTDAFSRSVSFDSVAFTLGGFVLVYTLLAVIETSLVVYVARKGLTPAPTEGEEGEPRVIELGY
jgi:cytochrome d ubiquinol oxidase subunit I